ncbi:hypothetical protein PSSM7_236 [Prochlorococcus phage P-SSM7]|uniref:Uncharacterized protein n=1 Tax=Prochlorococcus phage P-SSM7 TaxID=445688 RepID=E3SP00_9CAUD|nr:hypothetical protein PSSM7_236 [Prochlorococcus phage P-SSM7]ADO98871.1 hypothetical protein PSSM7_236 [Prochlorococcus phage P-SSM7]
MERSKPTKTSKERQEKVTIYFDKRALEEQKKEDEEVKQEELDKKAEQEKNIETGRQAVNAVGNLFLSPLVLMLVWNACIPGLFGLATLGYWSAMGLYVIFRILLRNS